MRGQVKVKVKGKAEGGLGTQWWLVFPRGECDADVRGRFEERFGVEPEQVVRSSGYVWAGPVPGSEVDLDALRGLTVAGGGKAV